MMIQCVEDVTSSTYSLMICFVMLMSSVPISVHIISWGYISPHVFYIKVIFLQMITFVNGSESSLFQTIFLSFYRVTHICVSNLTIISSYNGLSPGRRQAIIWTNAGIFLIRTSGINFSEISIEIHTFSFQKVHLKISSAKWRPFCLGLNV